MFNCFVFPVVLDPGVHVSRCPGRHFNLHSVQGIDFTFDQAKTNSSFYQTVSSYMLVTRNLSACIETSRNVDELEI